MAAFSEAPQSRFKVLYVDDEALSLKYFKQLVGEDFDVLTAPSAEEGLALVRQMSDSLAVVMSDQKLTGMQGTEFLAELREHHPHIVRILATAFSEVSTAVAAINDGAIYHYVSKPWDPDKLVATVQRAVEHFELRLERDRLVNEKATMIREMMVADRLAGYGVLAEGINHHLRNALVPVEVYLQLSTQSESGTLDDGIDAEFLSELRDGAVRQVHRITDILGRFAAVQETGAASPVESVSIRRIWEDAARQLEGVLEEKNLHLSIVADEDLPSVLTSRARLHHALRLVIEDAIERLSPGSEISVNLEHKEATERVAEHILMEVWDSGPAVDPARLASIFTPFAGRKDNPQHLGVSLATCYVTITGIGGWARAFNDPERGTVLVIGMPLRSPEKNASPSLPLEAWERLITPAPFVAAPASTC